MLAYVDIMGNGNDFDLVGTARLTGTAGMLAMNHYVCNATGAAHAHVITEDDHSAFGVSIPTVVDDDTGIAHATEHMVSSGSERFDLHNPLLSMQSRTLATSLGLQTAPDRTLFSSRRGTKLIFSICSMFIWMPSSFRR